MPHALIAPELEIFPNRYRWTVEDCAAMLAEGRLVGRFELLDGEVVTKMGQKPAHRIAVLLVTEWLIALFGARRVPVQEPIALPLPDGLYSEPEPDIAVTREATTAYADRHPGPEDLLLVVEVADTTLRTDLLVKSRLYARAAIVEYWTLDLNARLLHVHRDPVDGEYANVAIHAETETVACLTRPEALVRVADLLPPIF